MAITSLTLPDNNSSAHDDLYVVANSDNANAVDFKYVIDVFSYSKQLLRAKIYPNPDTGYGYFNFSNVVANEMKFDWFNPNGQLEMCELDNSGQITSNIQIRVGEDVSGLTTTNLSSGDIYVSNIIPDLFSRQNQVKLMTTNLRYLTDRLRTTKYKRDEDFYVGACINETTPRIQILQYNSSGTLLATNYISFSTPSTTNIFQLNISPNALIVSNGYVDFFNVNTAYYLANLQSYDGVKYNTKDSIRIEFACDTKYQTIPIHFMNKYGVFETARFNLLSRLTMNIENKSFSKNPIKFGDSVTFYDNDLSLTRDNNTYYESKVNYGSKYDWTYKLTMDFPTDEEYIWLAQLFTSPIMYAEIKINDTLSEYYPVTIKASNYEYSKYVNNRLKPLEIEIEMNQKRYGFKR